MGLSDRRSKTRQRSAGRKASRFLPKGDEGSRRISGRRERPYNEEKLGRSRAYEQVSVVEDVVVIGISEASKRAFPEVQRWNNVELR
jgi:hypothetical protein